MASQRRRNFVIQWMFQLYRDYGCLGGTFQLIVGLGSLMVFVLVLYIVLRFVSQIDFGNTQFHQVAYLFMYLLAGIICLLVAAAAFWLFSFFVAQGLKLWREPKRPYTDTPSIPLVPPEKRIYEQRFREMLPPGSIIDSGSDDEYR